MLLDLWGGRGVENGDIPLNSVEEEDLSPNSVGKLENVQDFVMGTKFSFPVSSNNALVFATIEVVGTLGCTVVLSNPRSVDTAAILNLFGGFSDRVWFGLDSSKYGVFSSSVGLIFSRLKSFMVSVGYIGLIRHSSLLIIDGLELFCFCSKNEIIFLFVADKGVLLDAEGDP